MYLNYIIESVINPQIGAAFIGAKAFGIAQAMMRDKGGKKDVVPCYVNNLGEGIYIVPDDVNGVTVYHKLNRVNTVQNTALKSFGDDAINVEICSLSLLVFGYRSKILKPAHDVAAVIKAAFPQGVAKDELREFGLKNIIISVTEINVDAIQVFQEEFKNVDFFLKPEMMFFKINYTIESTYLKECFTKKLKTEI